MKRYSEAEPSVLDDEFKFGDEKPIGKYKQR